MITPRRTRLLRVPTLRDLHLVLAGEVAALDPQSAADTFLVVPTRAAAEQARRTVEESLLDTQPVIWWPHAGPRADLYAELASRAAARVSVLSGFDREVLLARMAREVAATGIEPPFALRPAIVSEMLALYDYVRRQARTLEDFDRNLRAELEPAADTDRGAAQLLRQTRFLTAVFAAYGRHLASHQLADEHGLRTHLLLGGSPRPLRRVVVAVGDRIADADGLWPVDFTLLSALPDLAGIDLVATEAVLASGFLERVHAALPDLEEVPDAGAPRRATPAVSFPELRVTAADVRVASFRDREEELRAVARRIKAAQRSAGAVPLARQALVVRRPLPHLYLARSVFGSAGIPFETLDTLPLASEPYAAATDLLFDASASGFSRIALVALLRSPHFTFDALAEGVTAASVSALDRALAEARYLGGMDRLAAFVEAWAGTTADGGRTARRQRLALPALRAALVLAGRLAPLTESRPVLEQIARVRDILEQHARAADDDAAVERTRRVRRAVLDALDALGRAYEAHDPAVQVTGIELSATVRRWLGAQTFADHTGSGGLRIIDAQAARFAAVDEVHLLSLVEGEWPEPTRRSIFYPPSLLSLMEPAPAADDPNRRESDMMAAARAAFHDLATLAHHAVRASTFLLESDAVVEPSPFVDDLNAIGLRVAIDETLPAIAIFADEALVAEPPVIDALPPLAQAWAVIRQRPREGRNPRYLGEAGPWTLPRVSVSRVDRYLKCPFQFFASEVLGLEEEPEDAELPPPWERGRFLHAIFEQFFREWQQRGRKDVAPEHLADARALLADICERALQSLSPQEAALERARLFGSAASPGIVDRVLAMEAERPASIEQRFVEFELDAAVPFRPADGSAPREVRLRAKVDRVDLLDGQRFRVIDYKSRLLPDPKRSVQLQVYAAAVRHQLQRRGEPRQPAEAFYLSFEGDQSVRALKPMKGQSLDEVIAEGEGRMLQALDDIAAGHFPARPTPRSLCASCPFDSVCRKAFVEPGDA